jgi:hypothetical protein
MIIWRYFFGTPHWLPKRIRPWAQVLRLGPALLLGSLAVMIIVDAATQPFKIFENFIAGFLCLGIALLLIPIGDIVLKWMVYLIRNRKRN